LSTLEGLRLLEPIGVGRDGMSFRGEHEGRPVVVHRLVHAREDPARMRAIKKRLRAIDLAAGLGVFAVVHADLEGDVPEVVVERRGDSLTERMADGDLAGVKALELCTMLAAVLERAHRYGVCHGELCPSAVTVDAGMLWIDLTRFDTGEMGMPTALDLTCAPPEENTQTPAADGYAFARLVWGAFLGREPEDEDETITLPGALPMMLAELLAEDPGGRPPMHVVVLELARASAGSPGNAPDVTADFTADLSAPDGDGHVIGRFALGGKLGEGAMGVVWRATDRVTGDEVAIKLLSVDAVDQASQRFRREARLLAQVKHPHVAACVDAAPDEDVPWIAIELVRGETLGERIDRKGTLGCEEAADLVAQAARGVAAAHQLGIVHRDLKPDNIMLERDESDAPTVAKVVDFGIARRIDERESLAVTQGDVLIGTPLYMAPEQVRGEELDGRADVYSLAATLYEAIAGRPPFEGKGAGAVLVQIISDPPEPIANFAPDVNPRVAEVIDRALQKKPDDRYDDAEAFADALEEALRGPASSGAAHPRLPENTPSGLQTFEFEWELAPTPRDLWPFVSNTERLNRAVGLSAIQYERRAGEDGAVEVYGELKVKGIELRWREQPYEWIEGRRFGYVREYSEGPWVMLRDYVELHPREQGGTLLKHVIEMQPRGLVGRAAAALEVGRNLKKGLGQAYRRIEALLGGGLGGDARVIDPFEEGEHIGEDGEARLRVIEGKVVERGGAPDVVAALGDWLRNASAPDAARLRPRALAAQLEVAERALTDACLLAADEGALELLWDLLCPSCRIPAQIEETLNAMESHGHCEACDIDFELDVGRNIEAVFRVHPQIREAELATYCIGSPAHSPHVVAQMRVAPGERLALDLDLDEGEYRVGGRQLPREATFRVSRAAKAKRWHVFLSAGPDPELPEVLRAAGQKLVLVNDTPHERVVRIERTAERADALTAARLAASPLFRRLFRGELLRDGQLLSVSHVALARVELGGIDELWAAGDDPAAFEQLQRMTRALEDVITEERGAVIKLDGDGLVAAFPDPLSATRAAFATRRALAEVGGPAGIDGRTAVHAGTALMLTFDGRLDYVGRVTRHLARLARRATVGRVALSESVAADAAVARFVEESGARRSLDTIDGDSVALLLTPPV
jgi:serine/threonine protein kinase/class 3 adenylate cyclase